MCVVTFFISPVVLPWGKGDTPSETEFRQTIHGHLPNGGLPFQRTLLRKVPVRIWDLSKTRSAETGFPVSANFNQGLAPTQFT